MIKKLRLLRSVGPFDNVAEGANIPLAKLTLIYAENGRGKTTLAAILRSLRNNDPTPITERERLATSNTPHIILTESGGVSLIFRDGSWSGALPVIEIFDDVFVAENVCSGINVHAEHRQNLHELIIGAQGVVLNRELERYASEIELHNTALRAKADAIPAAARGAMTVDAFCALKPHPDIDQAIQETDRAIATARAADAVRQQSVFDTLCLPTFDLASTVALLRNRSGGCRHWGRGALVRRSHL